MAAHKALADRLRPAGMRLKETKSAIANLAAGQSVEWLGYEIRKGTGGVEARLSERNWSRLEDALAKSHDKPDAPIRALETIEGWIDQAGPCYPNHDVSETRERIEQIARSHAFEEVPTCDELRTGWADAHARWERTRGDEKSKSDKEARWNRASDRPADQTVAAVIGWQVGTMTVVPAREKAEVCEIEDVAVDVGLAGRLGSGFERHSLGR